MESIPPTTLATEPALPAILSRAAPTLLTPPLMPVVADAVGRGSDGKVDVGSVGGT
jgi:hypothetical protein